MASYISMLHCQTDTWRKLVVYLLCIWRQCWGLTDYKKTVNLGPIFIWRQLTLQHPQYVDVTSKQTKVLGCLDSVVEGRLSIFDSKGFLESQSLPMVCPSNNFDIVSYRGDLHFSVVDWFLVHTKKAFYELPSITFVEMLEDGAIFLGQSMLICSIM